MSPAAAGDVDPVREIRRVHVMLEDWYAGIRDDIEPVEAVMSRHFTTVDAQGDVRDRAETLEAMRAERETYRAAASSVTVEVDDVTQLRELHGTYLVTYLRRVHLHESPDRTRCTLWMRATDRSPTGLQWLHLSETPISTPAIEDED